jgi:hypothetical protein
MIFYYFNTIPLAEAQGHSHVKLPAHRAGLPGNEISFFIVPLDPLGLSTHCAP